MANVAFRADASLQIGTGHVMRCLTLADALKVHGAISEFICRDHAGNNIDLIRERGYTVHVLPHMEASSSTSTGSQKDGPVHASWLGADWQTDVEQTIQVLPGDKVEWLIVDHYAIDHQWENELRPRCRKLMVIDDLADRVHDCDLLLDQNLGRTSDTYTEFVPGHCKVLAGPRYALLRPEFKALRERSLKRRIAPQLKNLLITMGGIDRFDVTSRILAALKTCELPDNTQVTVVMGKHAPGLQNVQKIAENMPWRTRIVVNTNEMAQLMETSDLVIGAVGSTCWEYSCMGLPALIVVLAENQTGAAHHLQEKGVSKLIRTDEGLSGGLRKALSNLVLNPAKLKLMSDRSCQLSDGSGAELVFDSMAGTVGK